ncbi:bifunctional diguanylate cyclase/phosphohydrolase [Neobacillus ginsengisoli]|uniref:Diguanylate cyclase (GGDEF)-like protein/putative nucleotidyltransferase with HDIG domain n=1 Tax=Neobacillus ginsengisoli TaxID=904295 RepID=A0ABT9XU61_9BACI|nr:diguanylate cyclase [Neobacillus ginsengisoli]MDQ0199086.1 diguanylate cyclase (GGDEF)-like protein/putative nucleotidyltransferase with HDIG domain [Neobacillus ginsengisoli]
MRILKTSTTTYLFLVSTIGIIISFAFNTFPQHSLSEWLTIFALAGSILLLNHYPILLPPKGNSLSMDSSIFLACLFLFGLNITLYVLLINAILFSFTQRNIIWWKHVFNFAIYSLMIILAYYAFIFTGGKTGGIHIQNIIPYLISLSTYFVINVILIGIYFILAASESLMDVLKGIIKETIATYISTLMLSLVLVILMNAEKTLGLFLFTCISFLLSLAFKQHFHLFKEISEKANKDFLTGLNNHGYFKELLEKEVAAAKDSERPLSLVLLDIDDFKKYNDLYGHIQGDHLLQEFGALLKSEAERKNFTVARYGGEEFSIFMPNTNRKTAYSFMNELRKKANNTYYKGVEGLPYGCMSFSAGIAECEKETYSISELLNKADQAMYAAKDQGKNLVQIYNEHSEYTVGRSLSLEKGLDEAEQQLKIFLSKDVYTYRHSKRVYQYAVDFSRMLNLSEHERKTLILGALIHDIGKIEIPRDILNKKGKLEPHEWEMMKKHVTWGKEIISTNKKLEELIPLVELHHERYDGNGYPYGLKGKSIPKLARILCVIDSFDAMTTERPYQKTKTFKEAIVELRACAGKQFDPQFVGPFITMIKQLDNTCEESEEKVLSYANK